ncbi:hypothetical protein GP2_060_00120 [Gordonia paraffinivorans NBRC 108238]|uniref:Uncharacterized protein n=1 Tax=Gordonia paraffinivorans NBRC 108238 TaxID=1223543 RepID=A0ABQ0IRL5_9ACTN|nr:hypothetical protein GP2_060_00120 [Gordonia paraffinivorans NBRC 108238]
MSDHDSLVGGSGYRPNYGLQVIGQKSRRERYPAPVAPPVSALVVDHYPMRRRELFDLWPPETPLTGPAVTKD